MTAPSDAMLIATYTEAYRENRERHSDAPVLVPERHTPAHVAGLRAVLALVSRRTQ